MDNGHAVGVYYLREHMLLPSLKGSRKYWSVFTMRDSTSAREEITEQLCKLIEVLEFEGRLL